MYTTVRRYTIGSGTAAELAKRIEEGFVPKIKAAGGFQGYYVVDGGDAVIATISVFEERSGIEESDRLAADWVKENLAEFELSAPETTEGELLISAMP
jgi:hypothetical protein